MNAVLASQSRILVAGNAVYSLSSIVVREVKATSKGIREETRGLAFASSKR